MAVGPISYLIEKTLLAALETDADNLPSGTALMHSYGAELASLPAVKIAVEGGTEEPEGSSNFKVDVEITAFGRVDPDDTYASGMVDFLKVAGAVEEWLTEELVKADLEVTDPDSSNTGCTNTLKAHNIRLVGFRNGIDEANDAFEHSWDVELYIHQA